MSYKKFNWANLTLKPNYLLIPVNQVTYKQFNKISLYCKNHNYKELIRTYSGGISLKQDFTQNYSIKQYNYGIELVICNLNGFTRLQFRPSQGKGTNDLSGRKSFLKIKDEFIKDNIDIYKYSINNGLAVKKTIEKPYIQICNDNYLHNTYKNVHHLDINSSYPSGIAERYPELAKTINRIYINRKTDKSLKLALDASIGFMQSKWCVYNHNQYCLSNLSKVAIEINNNKIKTMLKLLESKNKKPLIINTDGIWYQGDMLEINESNLGGWKTDHKNCILRVKSKGAYEYIEDGKYTPVVRGSTLLDRAKPRSKWKWGDIYNISCNLIITYTYDDTTQQITAAYNKGE